MKELLQQPSEAVKREVLRSPEDEAGALACVVCGDGNASEMLEQLEAAHFGELRHRTILQALLYIREDGDPLDIYNLGKRLAADSETENAGGFDYIQRLPDKTASPQQFPSFLKTLREFKARRRMFDEATSQQSRALDLSLPIDGPIETETLEKLRFNAAKEPPPLRSVYTLAGTTICTPGNLTTITAAIKSGKSAVIGAMAGAVMHGAKAGDMLGFNSNNPNGLALLWFDSEQAPDDFWHCNDRALRRATLLTPREWFHSYCLTGLNSSQAWKMVTAATRTAAKQCGGVHSILLDGVADFVADVNDAAESNTFVATLHGMAIKYDCPIVCVIHFNPGSEKSRGHLGSQLERKAETNLALKKDNDETTVIYSTKNRRAGIPEHLGPRFRFSTEAGMHVTVESRQSTRDAQKRETLLLMAQDVFGDRLAMRYSELRAAIVSTLKVSDATAERRIGEMREFAIITKGPAGMLAIAKE